MRACVIALSWLLVSFAAAGCALLKKAPPVAPPVTIAAPPEAKVKASITLSAGLDVNPDRARTPKPVLVRVYQLRAATAFQESRFGPLADDDRKVLGDAFITRDDYTVAPGQTATIAVLLAPETRYVGVMAEFHDALDRSSQWHAVASAARRNLLVSLAGIRVSVSDPEEE